MVTFTKKEREEKGEEQYLKLRVLKKEISVWHVGGQMLTDIKSKEKTIMIHHI